MKFIKYLILSACFFISMAWAGVNNEGSSFYQFAPQTAMVIIPNGVLNSWMSWGAGYKGQENLLSKGSDDVKSKGYNGDWVSYFQWSWSLSGHFLSTEFDNNGENRVKDFFNSMILNIEYVFEKKLTDYFSSVFSVSPIMPVITQGAFGGDKNFLRYYRFLLSSSFNFGFSMKVSDSILMSVPLSIVYFGLNTLVKNKIFKKEIVHHPNMVIIKADFQIKYFMP